MRALPVLARSLRDQRRSLAVWTVSLCAVVGLYGSVYSSIGRSSTYAKLFRQLPNSYRALFGLSGNMDFSSPAGYLTTEVLSFMAPLLLLAYAIGAGAAAVAGEEERGTLDLLLANPVSRRRVVVEKFAALAFGSVLLAAVFFGAVQLEGRASGMVVSAGGAAAVFANLALLAVEFGALAIAVGSATGHLAAARAVPAVLAVAAYLVNGLAPVAAPLRPLRRFSPFYQYLGHDPLHNGADGLAMLATAASAAVFVALAAAALTRRDVHA